MRAVLILAATAAVLPVPAFAQDRHDGAHRVAREMNDPVRQAEMAATVEDMAGVLLDVPVAPLLRAAATIAGEDPQDIDPDARVGDLVGPGAAEAPREFAHRLPQAMGAMADMAVAMESVLPRLAEVGARARAQARRHHD